MSHRNKRYVNVIVAITLAFRVASGQEAQWWHRQGGGLGAWHRRRGKGEAGGKSPVLMQPAAQTPFSASHTMAASPHSGLASSNQD